MLNNIQNVANAVASNLDTIGAAVGIAYIGRYFVPAFACKGASAALNLVNQKDYAASLQKTSSDLFKKATASLGRDLTVAGSFAVAGFAGKTVNDKLFPEVKDESYYTNYIAPVVNPVVDFGYAAKDVVANHYGKIGAAVGTFAMEEIGRKMIATKAGKDYEKYGTYAHTAAFKTVSSVLSSGKEMGLAALTAAKVKAADLFPSCCGPKAVKNEI